LDADADGVTLLQMEAAGRRDDAPAENVAVGPCHASESKQVGKPRIGAFDFLKEKPIGLQKLAKARLHRYMRSSEHQSAATPSNLGQSTVIA
jgi:hypothetical protein